ncbi:hypothetical protein NDU88_002500 [Pleurodeles waltl]|uniref:Uncharacterized protein n=1 Tax=Pleurodeles waltl TaxID=8319 RepID=A0AAV7TM07_PLEWA|nr:hypothetical protein NDU88_002500 [Pleurodeles waltl]
MECDCGRRIASVTPLHLGAAFSGGSAAPVVSGSATLTPQGKLLKKNDEQLPLTSPLALQLDNCRGRRGDKHAGSKAGLPVTTPDGVM